MTRRIQSDTVPGVGERIGPYEILDTLGSGGMGTVYLASDVRLRMQELWSIAVDGTGERRVADLRSFRTIDVFFDVSRHGHLAWAPLRTGDHQLWTAQLK